MPSSVGLFSSPANPSMLSRGEVKPPNKKTVTNVIIRVVVTM